MTDERSYIRSNFTAKPTNNKILRLTYFDDFILELSDVLGGQLEGEDLSFAQGVIYDAWEEAEGGLYAKDDHGNPSLHESSNPPLAIGLIALALTDAGYTVLITAATTPEQERNPG